VTKPEEVADRVIKRYVANKRLIEGMATAFGVVPLFVWQPTPMYHYEGPGTEPHFGGHERSRSGYPKMAQYVRTNPLDHFIWCADISRPNVGPLYIDKVHYSPRMSDMLARCIFTGAREQGVW
jgi:hypothetical protein